MRAYAPNGSFPVRRSQCCRQPSEDPSSVSATWGVRIPVSKTYKSASELSLPTIGSSKAHLQVHAVYMAQAIQSPKLVPKPKRPDFIPSTKFGPISDEKITLVDSPETLLLAYNTLFVDSAHREATGSPSAHLFPIGLDCEWLPFFTGQDATPVAILQVVSREHAFLIDMLHWCRPAMEDGAVVTQARRVPENEGQGVAAEGDYAPQVCFVLEKGQGEAPVVLTGAPAPYDVLNSQEVLLDAFVHTLFSTKHVTLVGFQFGYDMWRLQTSYPHLPVFGKGGAAGPRMAKKVVEVLEMARAVTRRIPRKRRVSLKELHQRILMKPIDKAEQMSNWAQRPLTMAQMRYAAFDGHSVVEMLDVLALRKPAVLGALAGYSTAIHLENTAMRHGSSFINTPKSKRSKIPTLPPPSVRSSASSSRTKQSKNTRSDSIRQKMCTTEDVQLDMRAFKAMWLGSCMKETGQAGVVKAAATSRIRFSKDNQGILEWENCVMVFGTLGPVGVGSMKNCFVDDGHTLRLHMPNSVLVRLQQLVGGCGNTADDTSLSGNSGKPILLFCRLKRQPYTLCGTASLVDSALSNAAASLYVPSHWKLQDFEEVANTVDFVSMARSNMCPSSSEEAL